jgi:tetratricopeptide (TPR) repeat protein
MDLSGLKKIVKDLTQGAEQRAIVKAQKHMGAGQIDRAIETLREAHKTSPENNDVLFELARCLVLSSRANEAADALRTVLRRSPRAYQQVNEMIEELRARHAHVSPLYDAVAEHFIRHDNLKAAFDAMERLKPEELRAFVPRHRGKWDQVRKSAPDAQMAKATVHSANYLALSHEVLKEYDKAAEIYRAVVRTNPDELPRILSRLEALLARDYHNTALRVAVADLLLQAGRDEDALQQFGLSLESDARSAPAVAARLEAAIEDRGARPALSWLLASARLAAGDQPGALEAMRPLVEGGALLDQVIGALQPLAAAEKSGAARRLLASALIRRKQPQSALEALQQVAEEEGQASIREPLEELVAAHPKFARAHHLLADIHLAEGRAAEAVECMRRTRELAPGEDSLLIPKLTRVLEADPGAAPTHLFLADLLLASGDRDRAVVVLRHLVRLAPASAAEALKRFATILQQDAQSPRARIGAAEACTEAREFPQALQHLEAVAQSHPALAPEYLRALVLLAEAQPAQYPGIAAVLRGLEPRASLPHAARFALGEAAFFGGDPPAAVAAFRAVLEGCPERAAEVEKALERFDRDDPRTAEARYLLAILYLDRRQHAAAVAELARGGAVNRALLDRVLAKYEEILAAGPDDHQARSGYVQALLAGRHFDRVLTVGQEAARIPDDQAAARISVAMGDALRETGDPDAAAKRYFAAYGRDRGLAGEVIERLRKQVQGEGSHALASLALGKVLAGEGRAAEATEALRTACAADPKLRETILNELRALVSACPAEPQPGLAVLAYLLEDRQTAQAIQVIAGLLDAHPDLAPVLAGHLEEVLKSDPAQPIALYEMGRALQRMQLFPRSVSFYQNAFRQDAGLGSLVQKRLQEIMEAAPACPDPYVAACAIHAGKGKYLAAAETIQAALLRAPAAAEQLLPRLEEIWTQHRGSARIALMFAEAARRAGRHEQALVAYTEAARKDAALFDAALDGIEAIVKTAPKMGEAYLARGRAHVARLRGAEAVDDLQRAARLAPVLLPQVVEEIEALRARVPDSYPAGLVLADLYAASGREAEAARLLEDLKSLARSKGERLPVLVRLWRLASARHDDEAARACLAEAERLAPDRNHFLARVHEVHLALLRTEAARLGERVDQGSARGADLKLAVRALVDLGDLEAAAALIERHAGGLDAPEATRLRAEIAQRRGDHTRASEQLRGLGPSRALAFSADRAGDLPLAAKTLESLLAAKGDDPALRIALGRVYRAMMAGDLWGAGPRLQAETTLTFTEGAAS